jgi:molybdopterin converting factor small subunit
VKITVHYLAQVRQAAGRATEQIELDRIGTLREIVVEAARRGGEPLRRLLLDGRGEPHPALLLFVGDNQVSAEQLVALRDGDVVTVLSPMAGG